MVQRRHFLVVFVEFCSLWSHANAPQPLHQDYYKSQMCVCVQMYAYVCVYACVCVCDCVCERERKETEKYRARDGDWEVDIDRDRYRDRENGRIFGVPLKISSAVFYAGWMCCDTLTTVSHSSIQAAEETMWIPGETLDIGFGIEGLIRSNTLKSKEVPYLVSEWQCKWKTLSECQFCVLPCSEYLYLSTWTKTYSLMD